MNTIVYFEIERTEFDAKCSSGQGHEAVNFESQKVKIT